LRCCVFFIRQRATQGHFTRRDIRAADFSRSRCLAQPRCEYVHSIYVHCVNTGHVSPRDASEIATSRCKNLLRPSAAVDRMASIAVVKVPHAPIYDSVCAPSPQQHVRHDIRQVSLVRTSHPFPRGVAPIVSVGRDSSHPHMHSEPRQNEFLPEPPDGNVLQHLVSVRV